MDARADAEKAGRELRSYLAKQLVFGYPESRQYVPRSCFEKRITLATIKQCLPDARQELLDFIWNSAQKLFAILLYSKCLPGEIKLESALQTFKDRHLTDDQLPLPRYTEQCTCMHDQTLFCPHEVPRETLVEWDFCGWEHFYADQWKFLAPEFKIGEFDYVLDEQSVLPIKLRDGHGEGSFGDVREGELNPDHARVSERRGRPRHVAIKTFKNVYVNDPQGLSAQHAWKTEAKNLRELSERDHPHLIRRVATVVLGRQYIILSEWANGGDLKNFWEQELKPSVRAQLVSEVVTQLCGLASAIDLMHNGNYMGTPSPGVSRSSSTHTLSPPLVIGVNGEVNPAADTGVPAGNSNWRHGDLKPENILRFVKADELVGTLRISDLGLAKRHAKATELRREASITKFGTLNYEPPEATTKPNSPRSRLYDIWSFGCILLEFVVWLLYGHQGLDDLWRLPAEKDATLFWSRLPGGEEPHAKVNSSVAQVMDIILATNPACRSPSAIRDLLMLVKDRVLVPALPGVHNTILPEYRRIQANVLLEALEKIKDKCADPRYCCPGQLESNARLPTNTLQFVSRNISDTLHIPVAKHGSGAANLQVPSSAVRAQRVMHIG